MRCPRAVHWRKLGVLPMPYPLRLINCSSPGVVHRVQDNVSYVSVLKLVNFKQYSYLIGTFTTFPRWATQPPKNCHCTQSHSHRRTGAQQRTAQEKHCPPLSPRPPQSSPSPPPPSAARPPSSPFLTPTHFVCVSQPPQDLSALLDSTVLYAADDIMSDTKLPMPGI